MNDRLKLYPLLIYSFSIAVVALLLKWLEYRFWIRGHLTELYTGLVAALFLGLGIWMGLRWTTRRQASPVVQHPDPGQSQKIGLSKRERQVLQLIAEGHSNQEIADRLFVSLSTVKSHVSNVYSKLDVKRRTQAIQKAKELKVL